MFFSNNFRKSYALKKINYNCENKAKLKIESKNCKNKKMNYTYDEYKKSLILKKEFLDLKGDNFYLKCRKILISNEKRQKDEFKKTTKTNKELIYNKINGKVELIPLNNNNNIVCKWNSDLLLKAKIKRNNAIYYCNNFSNNNSIGYSFIKYPDGAIYIGEIYNLQPNGYGEMFYKNGRLRLGMWENGVLTREKTQLPQCGICMCEDTPDNFRIACGQCKYVLCNGCYKKYYKPIQNGDIVSKNTICCPFCRQTNIYLDLDKSLLDLMKENNGENYKIAKCKKCHKYGKLVDIPYIEGFQNYNDMYCDGYICNKCIINNENAVESNIFNQRLRIILSNNIFNILFV